MLRCNPTSFFSYEFVIHEGCIHGFCVRATLGSPNINRYHAATKQAIDCFNKYLK